MSNTKISDVSPGDLSQTLGVINVDAWNSTDSNILSYLKSPMQQSAFSTNSNIIGKTLRNAIINFLDTFDIDHTNMTKDNVFRSTRTKQYEVLEQPSNKTTTIEITNLAPVAFENLRESIQISRQNFRASFADGDLINFVNTGKSGSQMYKTFDAVYVLKTLRNHEAKYLIQILNELHLRYSQIPTLMTRYVGCYSIRIGTLFTTEIYIVVMVNNLPTVNDVHEIYDLKGSTVGRLSTVALPEKRLKALKDLDFESFYPKGIRIPSDIYHSLKSALQSDIKELKKMNITDYSLMLGIHHLDYEHRDNNVKRSELGISTLFFTTNIRNPVKDVSKSSSQTQLTKTVSTTTTVEETVILTSSASSKNDNDSLKMENFLMKPLKLIQSMIAPTFDDVPAAKQLLAIPGVTEKGHRVLLYVAFIDILQTYDNVKQFQHMLQNLRDRERKSQYRSVKRIVYPNEYEKRLTKFLFQRVFIDAGQTLQEILKQEESRHKHGPSRFGLLRNTRFPSLQVNDRNSVKINKQQQQNKQSERKLDDTLSKQNGSNAVFPLIKTSSDHYRTSVFDIVRLLPIKIAVSTTTVQVENTIEQQSTIVNPLFNGTENKLSAE
ncbi:unnamed protein product [Didymodactylos carnosus]|uniref:PIPK domain-containing protein n=1 Tax=Didymodactylos carnosus TaxID=1234261 RepID=A0A815SJL7_9BILA|nr:unnamed protein product [Didymodactylos carnosus]CAF1490977.1 unnamed protein product [Didymodactylos carnosus]CAF4094654.1 unnamed protein product [Didymodactylos carnosus]CAF4353986.1 unnamed protein product [Didymodactylos carnosus]